MSQNLVRREQLTERIMLRMSPSLKRRLYKEAASRRLTASDISRSAILALLGGE
jgi:hypothetical protein